METTKKSLLIFLALIIVGGSVYGGFYLLKKYVKKVPVVSVQQIATTTPAIPGFTRDLNNSAPRIFPKDLVLEKDIQVVESYEQVTSTTNEGTYRYVSKLVVDEAYDLYFKYLTKNGYANISANREGNYSYGLFQKQDGTKVIINVSFVNSTQSTVVDIVVIKQI